MLRKVASVLLASGFFCRDPKVFPCQMDNPSSLFRAYPRVSLQLYMLEIFAQRSDTAAFQSEIQTTSCLCSVPRKQQFYYEVPPCVRDPLRGKKPAMQTQLNCLNLQFHSFIH